MSQLYYMYTPAGKKATVERRQMDALLEAGWTTTAPKEVASNSKGTDPTDDTSAANGVPSTPGAPAAPGTGKPGT